MDNSGNYYDLLYFSNPSFLHNIENQQNHDPIVNNDDLLFYKRRIFTQTRDFLNGKKSEDLELNNLFNIYIKHCIEYFKFKDKSSVIQDDYIEYNQKKSTTIINDPSFNNISFNNKLLMKEKPQKIPKITDHIIVKNKRKTSQVIPKIRKINLKNEKYKGKK